MQNFTLRFKGKVFYLLALSFFIGTLTSYGQDCATVADDDAGNPGNQQTYCYLQTIQDLIDNGTSGGTNTAIFETDNNANDTDPIPSDELLTDNVTYYVGSTTETCDREAVEITVNAAPTPENTVTDSRDDFTLSPCVSSGFTVSELEDLFNPENADYVIEVYDSEFGTTALMDSYELVPGESYFVGQVSTVLGNCPSTRAAVGYDPTEAPGPTADANQTFCESATVADLMASGTEPNTQTIRWYRNRNSSTPLADDVALIDGEDYFASQIVNDRNDPFPPCETPMADRTAVVVTLTPGPDAGADNTGIVCEGDVSSTFPSNDAVRNYYLDLLEAGVPTNGTFNPTISQIVNQYQSDADGLGDFTTTYTIGSGSCTDSVDLTVSIIEETPAQAGSFDDIEDVCAEDPMMDLTTLTNNDADATSGGTFTGTGVTDNQFDPSVGEGEYEITYTVDETSGPCVTGTDSTTFTIFVNEANAGSDITETVCSSQIEDPSALVAEFSSYLTDRDTDGTFNPSLSDLYAQYQADMGAGNLPQTYNIVYTVTDGTCTDDANIELTVNPSPDAGEDGSVTLSNTDDPVNLINYLGGSPDAGGTWSPGDGTFDPATDTPGNYTYTVSNSFGCEDSAVVAVTVEDECADVTAGDDNTGVVCESDVAETFPSNDEVRKYYLSLLDAGVSRTGTFDPTIAQMVNQYQADEDGLGDFTTTYTVNVDGCTDSTDLTIRIVPAEPANAGDDMALEFCTGDVDQNLYDYISDGANTDGYFVDYPDGIFSPSSEGEGTYTITYTVDDSSSCVTGTDTATFTIEVNEGDADAGEDAMVELLSTDDPINLFDELGGTPQTGGTWNTGDGTFDPATDASGSFVYTVTDGACEDSATVTVNVTTVSDECADVSAGDDNTGTVCISDVSTTFPSVDETRKYFLNLLDSGVSRTGTFNPTITQLINQYQADADGLGEFTTTYTVTVDDCSDSTNLTVNIVPTEEANAGGDVDLNFCSSTGDQNLYDFVGDGGNINGSFEGYADGIFNPSEEGVGTYAITYTVDESTSCVTGTATATFNIEVTEGTANAGADNTAEVCELGVAELFPDVASVRNFYVGLLEDGVSTNGTFNPTIQQIITAYQTDEDGLGDFSTTYTVSEGDCSDSAELNVTIFPASEIAIDAVSDQDVCANDDAFDLYTLLGGDTDNSGEFEGYADGMFDPSVEGEGSYSITYSIEDSENCAAGSTTFNITVTDAAYAGEDMDLDVCMNAGEQNLFDFLSADADLDGEFTLDGDVITDGLMNPADFAAGDYEVIYTAQAINDCGDDTATFSITVQDSPDAPDVNDISFCAIQSPTGADLIGEDDSLTFYSDAELSMMVAAEDEVVAGTYYVTQRNDAGCESDAASFEVVISDPGTPTIDDANPSFCEYDDATIADLNDAVDQTSNVTWYASATGTEPLSTGTSLQDGAVYYASLYDPETDCDSSERLQVTVTIEECPLLFPEGISPNGDGLNDEFDIENIEREYPNYSLEIYNRWGEVVYKGNASTPEWDGSSNQSGALGDDVLPVGVYFYLINFNDGETAPRRGKVYLSR